MPVEHHYHETTTPANTDSSALTVIVAIVAILFIVGLGILALRAGGFNFGGTVAPNAGTDNGINVDVNTPADTTLPDGQMNVNP